MQNIDYTGEFFEYDAYDGLGLPDFIADDTAGQMVVDVPTSTAELPRQKRKYVKKVKPPKQEDKDHEKEEEGVDKNSRFDRMPVTVGDAAMIENEVGVPCGSYFALLDRKRIVGIINIHDRWLKRTVNKRSEYADIQRKLRATYIKMLADFDVEYASLLSRNTMELGRTRKRVVKK
jgi:hypothetical protein